MNYWKNFRSSQKVKYKFQLKLMVLIVLVINFNSSSAQNIESYNISYNPVPFKKEIRIEFTPGDLTSEVYFNSDLDNGYHPNTVRKHIMTDFFAPEYENFNLSIAFNLSNYPYSEYYPRIRLESFLVEYQITNNKIDAIQHGGIDPCCLYQEHLSSIIHSSIEINASHVLDYSFFNPVRVFLENGTQYEGERFTLQYIKNGYHTDQKNTMVKAYQQLSIDIRVPDNFEVDHDWNETAELNLVIEGTHDPILFETLANRFENWSNLYMVDTKTGMSKIMTILIWTGIGIIVYGIFTGKFKKSY